MTLLLGSDLQSLAEFAKNKNVCTGRHILTEYEKGYAQRRKWPLESLAGLLAAKEAFIKAASGLAAPLRFTYLDIEIRHAPNGRPFLSLRRDSCLERGLKMQTEVTISHSADYVTATVALFQ